MTQSRVLVTGANGLLGQSLTDRLYPANRYDLLATGRDEKSFHPGSPAYTVLDICDPGQVETVLSTFGADVLINCAAMTQVDRCEEQRDRCWAVNADAVEHLAALCHQQDVHLVHVSTDFVFDGSNGPYTEDDDPDPVNFYGAAKLAGERAIRDSDLERWSIARTVLVYGTAMKLKRSNIALWLVNELAKGDTVQIVTDQWRTPTYVPDLAAGIQQLVSHRACGIYHLSGSEFISVFQFARRLARCFGYDTSLVQPTTSQALDQKARRPPKTGFIIDKARADLGFQPHSIETALQDLSMVLDLPTALN